MSQIVTRFCAMCRLQQATHTLDGMCVCVTCLNDLLVRVLGAPRNAEIEVERIGLIVE